MLYGREREKEREEWHSKDEAKKTAKPSNSFTMNFLKTTVPFINFIAMTLVVLTALAQLGVLPKLEFLIPYFAVWIGILIFSLFGTIYIFTKK